MKHLNNLFIDWFLEMVEAYDRTINLLRKKPKPSLIVDNVLWFTNSGWMDRLVSYKQLELWTADR